MNMERIKGKRGSLRRGKIALTPKGYNPRFDNDSNSGVNIF